MDNKNEYYGEFRLVLRGDKIILDGSGRKRIYYNKQAYLKGKLDAYLDCNLSRKKIAEKLDMTVYALNKFIIESNKYLID